MKRKIRRMAGLILAILLLANLYLPAAAAQTTLQEAVAKSAAYMLDRVSQPQVGTIGGEWAVIGLARSGYEVPQSYWDTYYAVVEEQVEASQGVLHDKKYTEFSRVILALTAIGADPTDVAGYNLLAPLGDFDKTVWQGINGPIWALIALDSGNYAMPQNASATTQATRQMYVEEILSRQLDCGGWNLTDRGGAGEADPDVTGMALQALAPYQDQEVVKEAVEKGLTNLSQCQDADGGYASYETSNSESVVQVIVALCALGIDLEDERFVKNGNSVLDNLLSYQQKDGSFLHTSQGQGDSQMASEQGLYGLVAAVRAEEGKSGLYEMDDVTIQVNQDTQETVGLPGKLDDVKQLKITAPGTTFPDVDGHKNQQAIEALAAREVVNGMASGQFQPDATMTRAEFAAIVVRALGLTPKAVDQFQDVPAEQWYAPYIGTAYTYGIVTGREENVFDPNGTITRQEAATMVARAAGLCGMDTQLQTYEIRDILAQFPDYVTVSQWAQQSVAFCYQAQILDQSDYNVEPARAVLRCEIAQMVYNLLKEANLL